MDPDTGTHTQKLMIRQTNAYRIIRKVAISAVNFPGKQPHSPQLTLLNLTTLTFETYFANIPKLLLYHLRSGLNRHLVEAWPLPNQGF